MLTLIDIPRLGRLFLALLCGGMGLVLPAAAGARAALRADPFSVERGFPPITVYSARVHQAGAQTFDITQGPHGTLYFGNLGGVAIFDGAWWRMVSLPKESAALTVRADAHGRIAVGGIGEMGFIEADAFGTPIYRSLIPSLLPAWRDVGEVTSICAVGNGVLFMSDRFLFLVDHGAPRLLADFRADGRAPRGCFTAGGSIWLAPTDGLRQIDPRSGRLLPPIAALAGQKVNLVLPLAGEKVLVALREGGLLTLERGMAAPFSSEANAWLRGKIVVGGCLLVDGRIVIATRLDGLLVMTPVGEVDQVVDAGAGLPDSVLEAAFTDREGSLWLAFDGPIARVDLGSPVSLLDGRKGVLGATNGVARFGDALYVGTSHGLFALDERTAREGSRSQPARRIAEFHGAAWSLLSVDDALLIGTEKGIMRLDRSGRVLPVYVNETVGIMSVLTRSSSDPARVWAASREGLAILRYAGGEWHLERMIAGAAPYISSIVEKNGVLWCGTVFDGVQRIEEPGSEHPRIRNFGAGEIGVAEVAGRPVFVEATGRVIAFDARGKPVADPLLGHLNAPRGFFLLAEDRRGDVWINSRPPRRFPRLNGRSYSLEGIPLVQVDANDIQYLRADDGERVWFGTDQGLFRYESGPARAVVSQPAPLIRKLSANDRLLFGGVDTALSRERRALPFDFRRVRIEFAPASFRPGVTYQYRLDPIDAEWSRWSDEPFVDYTNLSEGDYTFRLRSRGAGSAVSAEARLTFSVLPPWYRTPWMLAIWLLMALMIVGLIIRIRTNSLRRDAERLREGIARRTEELRETVQQLSSAQNQLLAQNDALERLSQVDELTGLANRRYFQQSLAEEWRRALRRQQPLALVLLDLDHFKDLNDSNGHLAGDACLREIGRYLSSAVRRAGDVVARYGGEEFGILLPGTGMEAGAMLAETLRAGIERLELPEEIVQTRITASCGVASFIPQLGQPIDLLFENADRALYAAKQGGRNCVRLADEINPVTGEPALPS